jgi:hypothetical protein
MRGAVWLLVLPLWSCTGYVVDTTPTGQSIAELCAGAAIDNGNGTATAMGCPFEQQLYNIQQYGNQTPDEALHDASGRFVATASARCGTWRVGTDVNGVTITTDISSGEVRAHGMVHAGYPLTTLPASLPAPFVEH